MFELLPVLVIVVCLIVLLPYLFAMAKDAPFVPMDEAVVERVMKITRVDKGDVFYDLGSGDGRLVISAAMRGARAIGIEINFFRVWYSRVMIALFGLSAMAKIIKKDLFEIDISNASVVNLYLLPQTNEKLREKLKKELKKGTRLVTVGFAISGFELVKVDERGTIFGPIRLYLI